MSQVATAGILGQPRGRLLSELCGHSQTAAELAERVGTSSNAVRVHLDALRQAGLVQFTIERRGVGKPTHVYALTESAEYVLSAAYGPALRAILAALRLHVDEGLGEWLHSAGARLAREQQASAAEQGTLDSALELLRRLGAFASLERGGHSHVIRSACCPLGAATRSAPELCKLMEGALGAALPAYSVRERCDRGEHPRCKFVIAPVGSPGTSSQPA